MGSSSSGDGSDKKAFKFDVFLSFRGPDTRKTFTDHLFAALNRKGIFAFRDDEELQRGDTISDQLLKAIEDSRSAVVVLSPNYAASPWCLEELVKILERKEAAGMFVLPVFYNVESSQARYQLGSFRDAFEKFEKRGMDPVKLQKWKKVLKDVADLSGWSSTNEHEAGFIERIVNCLFTTLGSRFSGIPSELVGIGRRVQVLEEALDIKLDETRSVGIAGMGGSGKTTLARVVYERMLHLFEAGSFLRDVKEVSKSSIGLVTLQKQLLRETLGKTDVKPYTKEDGVAIIRSRLQRLKILVVLDDVDDIEQVIHLVGDLSWFGRGSRIIITSRDRHLLINVNYAYEVKLLDGDESLSLFRQYAFKKDRLVGEELESLSLKFCGYCGGLPLALKVLGSALTGRSAVEWRSMLEQLSNTPDVKISGILKISYDGLNDNQKKVFLYVACFFHGYKEQNVADLVRYLHYFPDINMKILKERQLIYNFDERVGMHDLLRELGKDIVHQECMTEAGRQSLLWRLEDISNVLDECNGTAAVEGLLLDIHDVEHRQHPMPDNLDGLVELTGLKLLMVHGWDVTCSEESKFLSNRLRVLCWDNYPLGSLPSSFRPNNLHCLVLTSGLIQSLRGDNKIFGKLERLDLQYSKNLTDIPDLAILLNLKFLSVEGCAKLIKVCSSRPCHTSITCINLKGCASLIHLPEAMDFPQLEFLSLVGCSCLRKFPEVSTSMENLKYLYLDGSGISELPQSVGFLTGLVIFTGANCHELRSLPDTFTNLECLERVNLSGCGSLERLPQNFGQLKKLKELHLDEKATVELPDDFVFPCLEFFRLEGCSNFERFCEICGRMEKLRYLHTDGVSVAELPLSMKHLVSQIALFTQAGFQPQTLANALLTLQLVGAGRPCLPMPNMRPFRRIGTLQLGTSHSGGSRGIESTPAEAVRFPRMEGLFLKARPRIDRIPTLSGGIENIRKLRPNEAGHEEMRQSAESLHDQLSFVSRNLTKQLRRPNNGD